MLLGCSVPTMAAGPNPARPVRGVRASGSASITGAAWKADNSPIPGAHVRLRNIITGKVATSAVADETGRFSFSSVEGGTYVVELLDAGGKVLAVGHAFAIAPGETVATFVRLGTKVPWFSGFFSNAAGAVASAASGEGVTAMALVQQPSSASPTAVR
jgi:hypothetical protein